MSMSERDAPSVQDLAAIDRDVARTYARWREWRRALFEDPEAHAADDPFAAPWARRCAGKSTYDALRVDAPSAFEAPWRDGLRAWVAVLVQARLTRDVDVALARAVHAPRGVFRFGGASRLVAWRDVWRGVLTEPSRAGAIAWLDAATELAGGIGALARERAERRVEVGRRLGAAEPAYPHVPAGPSPAAFARALLDATDDVARAELAAARRREDLAGSEPSPVFAIRAALARDAGDGWPAHLTARWLDDLFGAYTAGLRIEPPRLPRAIGAASFARALEGFGAAYRAAAGVAGGGPFALASTPYPTDAYRVGAAFGAAPQARAFHVRALGTSARVAAAQARQMAASHLFEVRRRSLAPLLSDPSSPPAPDEFEALTARVLGAPLPAAFRFAWPAAHDDEPARVRALATALPLLRHLVDRFDEDWFRNPRAFEALRGSLVEEPADAAPADLAAALAGALEHALG